MGFLSDLWDSITGFLSDLWDKISEYVVLALILVAIFFFPPLGVSGFFGVAVTASVGWTIAMVCLVGAYLLDPEEFKAIFAAIGEVISAIVEVVADVIASAAGAVASAFFSSPLGVAALAFGAWWFFLKDDDKKEDEQKELA